MSISKFPKRVEIQTISACNARCTICPHEHVGTIIPQGCMPLPVFEKIVQEIRPFQENTRIIPYLNNEPFLDPYFFQRLDMIKELCPLSELEISTNLSRCTPGVIERLCGYAVTELRISMFGFTENTYAKVMPGLKWEVTRANLDSLVLLKARFNPTTKISIVMVEHECLTVDDQSLLREYCTLNQIGLYEWGFLDRAGNVASFSNHIAKANTCGCEQNRPIDTLHIMHNGNVVLCCQDWKWENILGNIQDTTLAQVWDSDAYTSIREDIYSKNKISPRVCRNCKLSTLE